MMDLLSGYQSSDDESQVKGTPELSGMTSLKVGEAQSKSLFLGRFRTVVLYLMTCDSDV